MDDRSRRLEELLANFRGLPRASWPPRLEQLQREDRAMHDELLKRLAEPPVDGRAGEVASPGEAATNPPARPGEQPPTPPTPPSPHQPAYDDDSEPQMIGPYRVLDVLGEGGMGIVYVAEQREPVKRRVAVKVIKLGMDSKSVVARFEAERQALALMDHPNIATVLDVGTTARGQPYFVMELVKGMAITDYSDRYKLTLHERIALFKQVCEGVQHAHHKGVIHRDIKPSNVLVAQHDDVAVVTIIDFGLARATDRRLGEHTVYTEHGVMLGTPDYMSPEQAEMSGLDIDTRTDVYSLGVLLYELLVGERPLATDTPENCGMVELQRKIIEEVPKKPSTVVLEHRGDTKAAEQRSTTGRAQVHDLRGELDWITMKALEKDRRRRYQTPGELVADLDRYLRDEPVHAGPPRVSYRLRKFLHRYRRQVTVAALVFVALAAALVFALRAQAETQRALTDFYQLADRVKLANFERTARDKLWPEVPERVDAMQTWLAEVGAWQESMPDHEGSLHELRKRGHRVAAGDRGRATDRQPGDPQPVEWRFDEAIDQFRQDALVALLRELHEFEADHGTIAGVKASLEWAGRVQDLTFERHRDEWQATIAAVRTDPKYGGLELVPQTGLVPLGRDAKSQLFEFLFLRSGERPERDGKAGEYRVRPDTGIVFVLLPADSFRMGSTSAANPNERPVHDVRLDAFFLSKYELTQAQWMRLSGAANPSRYRPGLHEHSTVTLTNPVDSVEFVLAERVLQRNGLLLPTEAQWEYGCRAGTTTQWWTGDERETLARPKASANVADGWFTRPPDIQWEASELWSSYDDGFFWHAPVGSFPANKFGLHEMHGNVGEWTRDPHADYETDQHAEGDGAWMMPAGELRVLRGGNFIKGVREARSARRRDAPITARYDNIGVRPARRIDR